MCEELALLLISGLCKIFIYFGYTVNWTGNELVEVAAACQNQPSLYAISPASWNIWKQQDLTVRAGYLPKRLLDAKPQPNVRENTPQVAGGDLRVQIVTPCKHILHILMCRSTAVWSQPHQAVQCIIMHCGMDFKTRVWWHYEINRKCVLITIRSWCAYNVL